ncbi:hypothetical protein HK098_002216 [Nowakowskiella sp. JEL0407]|nr:hypothetical protein HK098_002216 [Nowakowskiella sp. JEL0407]
MKIPPPPGMPITPKCDYCPPPTIPTQYQSTVRYPPDDATSAEYLDLAREKLYQKLKSETADVSKGGELPKPQTLISEPLAKAIATRSNRQIPNLQQFANSIKNDPIRVAFDKIFNILWDLQLQTLEDKEQEAFFSFWLLEHIWPKWESNSAYRTPGFFIDVLNEYTRIAQETGQQVNEKELFIAVVAQMANGIVKYFSGPAEQENRDAPGSVNTNETFQGREETDADLATEISPLDTIPALLFLLLVNGLTFISSETPLENRTIIVECMSSCLAITLGPKCTSYTLTAFVSAFLQDYKSIALLVNLGKIHVDLTRPSFHTLASLIDFLDDFKIISEEESFQLLLRETWASIPTQTGIVAQRCNTPLLFTDIAFCSISIAVSLLNISQRKGLVGDEFPNIYAKSIIEILETVIMTFRNCFARTSRSAGATLASAAKIHQFLNLCTEILPSSAQGKLSELRFILEDYAGGNGGVFTEGGLRTWKWDYMLSGKLGVIEMMERGILDRTINGQIDLGTMCYCEVHDRYGDPNAVNMAGHACHRCRNLGAIITPKLVYAQKIVVDPRTNAMKKVDIVSVDEWMKCIVEEINTPELLRVKDQIFQPETPLPPPSRNEPVQSSASSIKEKEKEKDVKGMFGKISSMFGKGKKEKDNKPEKRDRAPAIEKKGMAIVDGAEAVAEFEGSGGKTMGGGNLRVPVPIDKDELALQMKLVNLDQLDIDKLMNETASVVTRAFTSVEFDR